MMLKKYGVLFGVMMMMGWIETVFSVTPAGVLPLDVITFDKIVDGHRNVLVKFDKKYSYGENQNEWETLAKVIGSSSKLLLAEVSVAEHGEKENQALIDRFSIKADSFPQYRLFKADESPSKPLAFEGKDMTSSALSVFLKSSGIWVGLEGSIEAFETLVKEFMSSDDESYRAKIGEKGKDLLKTISGESQTKSANYYMKVMANMMKKGKNYASDEMERLKKMLGDKTNLADDKLSWFRTRSNILSSFVENAKDAASSAKDAATSAAASAKDAASTAASSAKDAASSAAASVKDAANSASASVKDAANSASASAKDAANSASSSAKDAAKGAAASAKGAAASAKDAAKDAAASISAKKKEL